MKKKPKVIYLKIEKDMKMFISEWAVFLLGMFFIAIIFFPIFDIIRIYPDDGIKLGLLILFVIVFSKLIFWVRIPLTYKTSDITEEIRLELNKK